jgi:integrase
VTALLKAAEGSRYHPVLLLIAATGLRRGEALGLAWSAVDLDAGLLRVAATLARVGGRLVITPAKTDRSRREVPLHPQVAAMLRKHRVEQKAERLRAGNKWTDTGLVFCTALGTPVESTDRFPVVALQRHHVFEVCVGCWAGGECRCLRHHHAAPLG